MTGTDLDSSFVHRFLPGSSPMTLLLLHGTGGDESSLIPLGRAIDEKASLLSIRGKVLENGMPRFFRRFAEGVFDVDDIRFRARQIAEFLPHASGRYQFDLGRLTALGYSNGANMASSLILLHPDVLESAVLFRAMPTLRPNPLPDLRGKRVLISAGSRDPIVPVAVAKELEELFAEARADVDLRMTDATHSLTEAELRSARSWLQPERQRS